MMGHKKKSVLFLIIVAIVGGLLVICLGQFTADGAESENVAGSLFASDPNSPAGVSEILGSKELFFKTMFMVVLVAVLGAAAIYISRKLLPKIANLPGRDIRVVETVHLGTRKTLHLLKIGHQSLLIGSTNENITKLADVTDALSDLSEQEIDTVRV
jgi:flagellar biogenesis protein FliO